MASSVCNGNVVDPILIAVTQAIVHSGARGLAVANFSRLGHHVVHLHASRAIGKRETLGQPVSLPA